MKVGLAAKDSAPPREPTPALMPHESYQSVRSPGFIADERLEGTHQYVDNEKEQRQEELRQEELQQQVLEGEGEEDAEEGPMLDAEALRTADAIDSLLQEAMSVRSEAVKRYKQAILEKDTYEHAQMYNSLHKLPREKIAMYTQICKFRREAATARDQAQKSSKLFALERKQFREAQDALRQRAERAEASAEEAQAQAGELRQHLAREENRAAALEARLKDDLVRETAQRERLESKLRRNLEGQRISFELQIAKLKSEKDELELMVDHFRGQAQANMLSVVEMKIGLQGVPQSTNNVTHQVPKRHGESWHDEHWREAYVRIPGAKDVPKAKCMSQKTRTDGRADPDFPSRRRENTCSMP